MRGAPPALGPQETNAAGGAKAARSADDLATPATLLCFVKWRRRCGTEGTWACDALQVTHPDQLEGCSYLVHDRLFLLKAGSNISSKRDDRHFCSLGKKAGL